MLNQSDFLTSIKIDLGIYGLTLPFPNPDDVIMETIRLKTIPTFSVFVPHRVRLDLDVSRMNKLKSNYEESIYELPLDLFDERRILSVLNVRPRNKLLGSTYFSPTYVDSVNLYESAMSSQVGADLFSGIVPPFMFKFEDPNLLYLYNTNTMANELTIDFAVEHMPNMVTIKNTTWHTFMELAILDIKKVLYGALKHHRELQSAYGTVTLKIDDWENADNERKELIEHWKDVYHLDLPAFIII